MKSYTIWLCAAWFYAFQYVLRVVPSILKQEIMSTYDMTTVIFGQFAGVYYIGYTLAHIPLGFALNRYGSRSILPFGVLLSVFGMVPLLYDSHWLLPILGRFFLGIGSSCAFIGLVKVVQLAFAQEKFNQMLSYGSVFGLIGGMFAGAPTHYLLTYFDWRGVVLCFIAIGSLLCLLLWNILPSQSAPSSQDLTQERMTFKALCSNKTLWGVGILGGLMVAPMEGFADAWAVQSLEVLHHLNQERASQAVSLIYLAFAFGLVGLSYLSDKLGYKKTIILSGIGMLFSFYALIYGSLSLIGVFIVMFIMGFFCAYQVPVLCYGARFVSAHQTTPATAMINTILMVFGMVFHTIIGGCVDYAASSNNAFIQGTACHPTWEMLQKGFLIIPIALIIGTLGFMLFPRKTLSR